MPLLQKLLKTATTIVIVILSYATYKDYETWREIMNPSAMPDNIFGYFLSYLATLILRKDRRNAEIVDETINGKLGKGFLKESDIPNYEFNAPRTSKWSYPQRQTFPPKNQELWPLSEGLFELVKNAHPDVEITLAPSQIEGKLKALFIGEAISENEVVHVHPHDGTFHVHLSSFDAALVLDKGWGELFPWKGPYLAPKLERVLLFAPQSKDDIHIYKKILDAAVETKVYKKKAEAAGEPKLDDKYIVRFFHSIGHEL